LPFILVEDKAEADPSLLMAVEAQTSQVVLAAACQKCKNEV